MTSCSIRWCGKNSKKSNYKTDGITFHRFPKEMRLKQKWIDCTRRDNWFPSNYSVVCSQHFTEDCFYAMKHRRRLLDTAIPTLHLPVLSDMTVTSECVPANASLISSSSSQYESSSTPKVTERNATELEISSQLHSPIKKRLCRRVLELSNQVKDKNKTIKVLRDKLRYYKNKVTSLNVIIKELEKKSFKAEDADIYTYNTTVKGAEFVQ